MSDKVQVKLPVPHDAQEKVLSTDAKRTVICAGRRGGKTTLATSVAVQAMMKDRRVLLASATQEQADQFWDKAKEWLADVIERGACAKNEQRRILEWVGGGRIRCKTAYNAETLRGDYADFLVLDEAAIMDEDAWEDVGQPMLLDNDGDAWMISTPPKQAAGKWFREKFERGQTDDPDWFSFRWTSHDNENLSERALERLTKDMSQRSYRREILAEFLTTAPGALWDWDLIRTCRVHEHPDLNRIVIGVDPAGGGPDEVGIVVCAVSVDGDGYVLEDASMRGSPNSWASAVASAYRRHKADRVVAEKNYGGDMVESTLRTADANLPVSVISASRGKQQRAEPVAALYEQGKVHHVGRHDKLEDQMTTWDPAESGSSPDRVDALVWALTELMLEDTAQTPGIV